MVTFTEGAKAHVVAFLAEESEPLSVRIEVLDSSPLAPRYDLSLIEESERESDDQVFAQALAPGHLCLLRLKDQMYPGGDSMHHWPTLGLNTLRWAQAQGAVSWPAAPAVNPGPRLFPMPRGRAGV